VSIVFEKNYFDRIGQQIERCKIIVIIYELFLYETISIQLCQQYKSKTDNLLEKPQFQETYDNFIGGKWVP
jgi:hypothetical protein